MGLNTVKKITKTYNLYAKCMESDVFIHNLYAKKCCKLEKNSCNIEFWSVLNTYLEIIKT
jgi:hypothetical protein